MSVLSGLDLHQCLRARIHRVHHPPPPPSEDGDEDEGFVLYLPTVCLRHEQNPSFALACRVANELNVPLVVLAVVPDDSSHATRASPHRRPPLDADGGDGDRDQNAVGPSVVMTSRRLAFALQALSHACSLWSRHGAAVGIRVHARNSPGSKLRGARTPDHLTLASQASFVVVDEPFVSPFTTLVGRVEEACRRGGVECVRVDGSCTVPPVQVLRRRPAPAVPADGGGGHVKYDGVPAKAYQWQSKTERLREGHLNAAMEGHFDAPELRVRMDDGDLFAAVDGKSEREGKGSSEDVERTIGKRLGHLFPSRWKPGGDPAELPSAPDVRPFTSSELSELYEDDSSCNFQNDGESEEETGKQNHQSDQQQTNRKGPLHNFALSWPGADPSVPPCPQTIGTTPYGMARWNAFFLKISRYGRDRNDARLVHSVSRMSAYLNLGIVSIFRLVWEVKRAQRQQQSKATGGKQTKGRWGYKNRSGADKFEEEIVKWREMSYAHAFSRDNYDGVGSLPRWSVACLNDHPDGGRYALGRLATGNTGDTKWDAMQRYLVNTGELHNNVRMTWGKTVVEWLGCVPPSLSDDDRADRGASSLTLRTLCYLNDRYALDGLSPPSYAGLLWCMGWTDKPSGGGDWTIARKPAGRYRLGPGDFAGAERTLLASASGGGEVTAKRSRSVLDMMKVRSAAGASIAGSSSAAGASCAEGGIVEDGVETALERSDECKGTKRSGSSAIDSFFAKKSTAGRGKRIIG